MRPGGGSSAPDARIIVRYGGVPEPVEVRSKQDGAYERAPCDIERHVVQSELVVISQDNRVGRADTGGTRRALIVTRKIARSNPAAPLRAGEGRSERRPGQSVVTCNSERAVHRSVLARVFTTAEPKVRPRAPDAHVAPHAPFASP